MAGPEAVVVDATVAVKWFNIEDFSEEALALRDDHVADRVLLAAPTLLLWEVCTALRHSPELGASDIRKALTDLWDLQMVLREPDPEWMGRAIEESFERGLTLRDSSYIALAMHLRAPLFSADEELLSRAPEELARHISTYKTR